jgi:uncharacterized protein YbjT (DUF2867 family)
MYRDKKDTRTPMKIVVIGGSGRIGAKVVARLGELGHDALAASPRTGVNTLTGEGLDEALQGVDVVVDVSNAPRAEGPTVQEFFETSTRNLLDAETRAGVGHHVALSIVGVHDLPDSPYFRAKIAQENLIKASPVPHTIVQATQFFEFYPAIADATTERDTVRLMTKLVQPIAADDVARILADIAVAAPVNGAVEIAGPEALPLAEFIRRGLRATNDPRRVIADPTAGYFGGMPEERTLVPHGEAIIGQTRFEDWLMTEEVG